MSRSSAESAGAVRVPGNGRRRGGPLAAVLLLALDCVVAAGVCEVWVRAFVPVKNVCWTFDEVLGPHRCGDQVRIGYVEPGYRSTLRTNSQGFHDVERSPARPAGSYRIQVYGDSMIVGQSVSIGDTIPAALEWHLNELGLPLRFEVLNMASVDSTSSQLLVYERYGRELRPDLVLSYFMDDFPDNLLEVHGRPHLPHHRLDAAGELVLQPPVPRDLDSPVERLKRASLLYRAVANRILESKLYNDARVLAALARGRLRGGGGGGGGVEARQRALVERGWPLTLALIEAFRSTAEADGARFVLVDGLKFNEVNVATVHGNVDLEAACAARGIGYLATYDVLAAMKSAENRPELFFRDHHPRPLGNDILARALAARLAELLLAQGAFDVAPGGDLG